MYLKILLLIIFLVVFGMFYGGSWFLLQVCLILLGWEWLVGLFVFMGVFLGGQVVLVFLKVKMMIYLMNLEEVSMLVISGFYCISCNLMYFGLVCLLMVFVIYLGILIVIVIVFVFFWYMIEYQIKLEEECLVEKFEEVYLDYMNWVWCWIQVLWMNWRYILLGFVWFKIK